MKKHDPRFLAVSALQKFDESGDFLAEILDSFIENSELSPLDRGLFTELVYGTVRMRLNLDYIIQKFSSRPLKKIDPAIRQVLRIGAYQLLYLDRIPPSAAVNEAVKAARRLSHKGTAGFVNGLLRNLDRQKSRITYPDPKEQPVDYVSYRYSFPKWMVRLFLDQWGLTETEELCEALNEPPKTALRVNTLRASLEEVHQHFTAKGAHVDKGCFAPDVLMLDPGHYAVSDQLLVDGAYYIQDEGSALVAHAVDPQPGETVYDLCSAPGGKTTHMAQLMKDQGKIIAWDISAERLVKVEENSRRQGLTIVETRQGDASRIIDTPQADRVLVDAPCSGLGTMGHRPDVRWRKSPDEIDKLAALQRKILRSAARLVKPGGRLVYSVCTLTKAEGPDNAAWFLEAHPEFVPAALPEYFPAPSSGEAAFTRQFLSHRHGVDGFFIASFARKN